MKINIKIILLTIILSLIFASAAYAEDIESQTKDINTIDNKLVKNDDIKDNPQISLKTIAKLKLNKIKFKKTKKLKSEKSGCCSVYLQVNKNESVLSYRRDSNYAAPLYITKKSLQNTKNKLTILKEHKKVKGYFFHTIVTSTGWIIGTGGADIPYLNKKLEQLGINMANKNTITKSDMKKAQRYIKKLGIGHFAIKSPNGRYGVTITGGKCNVGTLKTGEYISVPNSASYFRKGSYFKYNENPVKAAIYLAGTDKWGKNRRNIMTYHHYYQKGNYSTKSIVDIYVSYDSGKLLKRKSSGRKDIIYYKGITIKKSNIPTIPNKKFLGSEIIQIIKQPIKLLIDITNNSAI